MDAKDRLFKSEASLLPALTGVEAADLLAKANTSEARDAAVNEALVAAGDVPEDEKQRVTKVRQKFVKHYIAEKKGMAFGDGRIYGDVD